MGLDINPVVPQGRQIIQGYGDGRFRISAEVYNGSVLVFLEETSAWNVAAAERVSIDTLQQVISAAPAIDILLIGCGPDFSPVPKGLRAALKEHGISLEWMDTGAACRTFNVLVAEERRVAAALIAV